MLNTTESKQGYKKIVVSEFDVTKLMNSPFTVVLHDSVYQHVDGAGNVVDTVIPNPDGLLKAVAQARVLDARKLNGRDLKFLRSSLGLKAKDFAKHLALTPEHVSRCENGMLALSPQSEMLVRIYTFVSTLPFTPKRSEDGRRVGEIVAQVFDGLNIRSMRMADDDLVLDFVLDRQSDRPSKTNCHAANDDDAAWDPSPPRRPANG